MYGPHFILCKLQTFAMGLLWLRAARARAARARAARAARARARAARAARATTRARVRASSRARDGWLKPGGHAPHGICSERYNGSSCGSIYSWALEEMELS